MFCVWCQSDGKPLLPHISRYTLSLYFALAAAAYTSYVCMAGAFASKVISKYIRRERHVRVLASIQVSMAGDMPQQQP